MNGATVGNPYEIVQPLWITGLSVARKKGSVWQTCVIEKHANRRP